MASIEPAGRNNDQLRKEDEQGEQRQVDAQEGIHAFDNGFHGDLADPGHDVQDGAHRGRDQAQTAGQHEDEAEIDGVHAGLDRQRQADRGEDQDGRRQVHGGAHQDQEQHHQHHEQDLVVHDRAEQVGQLIGQIGERDHVGGGRGGAAQEHDDGGGLAGTDQHAVAVGPAHLPVDDRGDEQRIDGGHYGGLGGGEDAEADAPQDDDRHEDRP